MASSTTLVAHFVEAPRLRSIRLLTALLIPAQITLAEPAIAQRSGRQSGIPTASETAVEVRTLSERDLLFAYHRILGTEPDFSPLAALDVDSRPQPTRPVRNPERERQYLLVLADRRIRAEFAAFDLNRRFRLQVPVDVLGYSEALGGIPIRSGLRRGFSMRDAAGGARGFSLRFGDTDAVGVMPTAGGEAAAEILQRAGLPSLGAWAGEGVLTMEMVFAAALPIIPDLTDIPIMANIVSARVESRGRMLHSFSFPEARAAAAASRRHSYPSLPNPELSGVRIGMAMPDAMSLALRTHPQARGTALYDGLPEDPDLAAPQCSSGLVADIRAFSLPMPRKDAYSACLALSPGIDAGAPVGRVGEVVQVRFLPDVSAAAVRASLERLHGVAEELVSGQLLWTGRDAALDGAPELLQLRADLVELEDGGPQGEPGVLISMVLRPVPVPAQ